jgi:hypothetical protein
MTRLCPWCGGPVPLATRRPRIYCSENCRKRAYEDRHRPACVDCGAILGCGVKPGQSARCRDCYDAFRTWSHEVLLSIVEGCWHDGWRHREIAVGVGRDDHGASVSPELAELRKRGRIGYRRPGNAARAAA